MQKKTNSILEELANVRLNKDPENFVEHRASHIIDSAINLVHYIRENFDQQTAYTLEKKFNSAIKNLDSNKYTVHIYPALFKKSRFEILLEKATELGVKEIHPLIMNRSVFQKIDLDRCKKILIASAKQCRRSFFPIIHEPKSLESLLKKEKIYTYYACHLEADLNLLSFNVPKIYPINLIIGPEGGFSENELGLMEKKGIIFFSLGIRRLRSETAAITSLALLNKMV